MQKTKKNLGHMLTISQLKMAVFNGHQPIGMSLQKINKIKTQVKKRLAEQASTRSYQPFTSKASRRKPKQVGA